MVRAITLNELRAHVDAAQFPYEEYVKHVQGDRSLCEMWVVSSEAMEVRARGEWNSKGREVYDREALSKHAALVCHGLRSFQLLDSPDFIVQHEGNQRCWLPGKNTESRLRASQIDLLSDCVSEDLVNYQGAFQVGEEVDLWLSELADYPYLLRYRDVEFVSMNESILVRANHHLAIHVYVVEKNQAKCLEKFYRSNGLRVVCVRLGRGNG